MYPLGKNMMVFSCLIRELILIVHIWPAGINDNFTAYFKFFVTAVINKFCQPFTILILLTSQGFHVIYCFTVVSQSRINKIKDKSGIIVIKISVGIFNTSNTVRRVNQRLFLINFKRRQETWGSCKKFSHSPVEKCSKIKGT